MELRYLLDTNIFIYIQRSRPESVLQRFRKLQPGEAGLSIITYGELLYGIAKSDRKAATEAQLQEILRALPVLALPDEAPTVYGSLRAELEASGIPIGNNDLWIASHAIAAGLILVTNNEREFRRVRGLKIQNWAA